MALTAAATGMFSVGIGVGQFALVSVGGLAIGLMIAWMLERILRRLEDSPIENTLGLLAPYAAYLSAETLHVSGVLATVAAGLYLGQRSSRFMGARTRMQASGVWSMLTFLLNGLLFILLGLQLHIIVLRLAHQHFPSLILDALWIGLTVIVARIVWIFPAAYLPRWISRRVRERERRPPLRAIAVLSWMGLRGGISLAAALAIPFMLPSGQPFPDRDTLIFITFGVILVTLVGQGLSLPPLIRWLGVEADGSVDREESTARLRAAEAASARLEVLAGESWVPDSLASFLRSFYAEQTERYCARDDGGQDDEREQHAAAYSRLKRELVAAEREAVISLRDQGTISDEALARVQRDLDLEALRLGDEESMA
jgi:Na+/H+ antiporter